MASFEIYRWFSEVMNRVHGFLGYLACASDNKHNIHMRAGTNTFQEVRRIVDQVVCDTCQCKHTTRQFLKLW